MSAIASFPVEQDTREPIRGSGPTVTGDNGAWCPIVPTVLLVRRLQRGKFVMTDLGLEKQCRRCREYWPFDTEFWYASPGNPDGVSDWCKACVREQTGRLAGIPRRA